MELHHRRNKPATEHLKLLEIKRILAVFSMRLITRQIYLRTGRK